jgi:hypothetical protein
MLSMVFESMDPMITRMAEAEEALGKCRLQTAFPRCTVKALIKDHQQKFLQYSCNGMNEDFEPDRVRLGAAMATCNAEVCRVLNELNVDQYDEHE